MAEKQQDYKLGFYSLIGFLLGMGFGGIIVYFLAKSFMLVSGMGG